MAGVSRLARYLIVLTYTAIIVAVPFFVIELVKRGTEQHVIAWAVGGVFVILTIPISVHTIVQHLLHYHRPDIQKYIVRILWMVPLYAVESYVSLRYKETALYIESIRDLYEAYVIYCFLYFLIAWFGEEGHLAHKLRQKPPKRGNHLWPFNWFLRPWRLGRDFLARCKQGTLQYVVVKALMTALTIILEIYGVYGEGDVFNLKKGYFYVAFISGASQTWAMYCLVLFYHATVEELAPMRPLSKFFSVKAVVFFSWWQSVALAVLVQIGVLQPTIEYSEGEVSKGLQNFLICVEMFVAAIAHRWVFAYKDFVGDIDDTVLTRQSAVASASRSSAIASGIPARNLKHLQGLAKSKAKYFRLNAAGSEDLPEETLDISDCETDAHLCGTDVDTSSPPSVEEVSVRNGLIANGDDSRSAAGSTESDVTGAQSRKPFFRAFLESTMPVDVMADIGRHVSRKNKAHGRGESSEHWASSSDFSGRRVHIEPAAEDIAAAASSYAVGNRAPAALPAMRPRISLTINSSERWQEYKT